MLCCIITIWLILLHQTSKMLFCFKTFAHVISFKEHESLLHTLGGGDEEAAALLSLQNAFISHLLQRKTQEPQ